MNIQTWFDSAPLTPVIPDPCVIVGGTRLVEEFFGQINERPQDGHLALSVPFINPKLVNELGTLQSLSHRRITCTIVTAASPTSEEACRRLLRLPWKSLEVFRSGTLHAKVYAFAGQDGLAVALIGSHNLTFSGTRRNAEVGVLIVSRTRTQISDATERSIEYIKRTGRQGTLLHDSGAWPEGVLVRRSA